MSRYYRDPATGNEIPIAGMRDLQDVKNLMLELCYPIGSMYMSTVNVSPATFLGGTWIQHSGYMLRGATSGVTAGQQTKDGGSDTVTLTGAQSGLKGHGHGFTQPTVNGGATNTGYMSANNPHSHGVSPGGVILGANTSGKGNYQPAATNWGATNSNMGWNSISGADVNHYHGQVAHTHSVSGGAVSDAGASNATSAHSVLPNYKNVYIWERTA